MASWATLTDEDVLSGMTQKERDDFAKTSVGTTVVDRILPILVNLVAEIQGMIGSRADNPLPPSEDVIPSEFKARAVSIARWRVLITIPGYNPGDSRKLDYEKADAFFMLVAQGKIRPRAEVAANAAPSVGPSGSWNAENKFVGRMNPTPKPGPQGVGRYANDQAPEDAG